MDELIETTVDFVVTGMIASTITFTWSPKDPATLRAVFHLSDEEVVWILGREMFISGMTSLRKVGDGDASVRYHDANHFVLRLSVDGEAADILLPSAQVADFLARTEPLVPSCSPMEEEAVHAKVDAAIAAIMAEAD